MKFLLLEDSNVFQEMRSKCRRDEEDGDTHRIEKHEWRDHNPEPMNEKYDHKNKEIYHGDKELHHRNEIENMFPHTQRNL